MRNSRPWLFIFLPFLYLAIILGFVAIQFSQKSNSFSQSLGDLTVSGKTSSAGEPAELVLRGRGLVFAFDANHSLQFDGVDGTTGKLRPLSWAWKDGNLMVQFQQGVELAFEKAEANGRSLQIRPVASEALKRFAALHIPFGPQGGARLVKSDRTTLLEIDQENTKLLASVDGPLDRIETDNSLVLTVGKNGFRPARIDPLTPGIDPEVAWLTLDSSVTPAAAETALDQYWTKVYTQWSSATSFSTALAQAWGQEALSRGDYPGYVQKIQNLMDRDRQSWGFDASPYLGNIVELTAQERRSVELASSRSQPDWANQRTLWLDARLYGPSGSADRVKGLLLSAKIPDDNPGKLSLLQNLLVVQGREPSDAVAARIDEVLKNVLTLVIRREGDLFVKNSDGFLDLRSGLVLGRMLLDYSRSVANQSYAAAGAQLIATCLSYQDPTGRLPETLITQNGKVIRQEGSILPETVYGAVRPAKRIEEELDAWGPGAFVSSPNKLVSKTITAADARFTFRFPVGSAEHIVITGVSAFDHITLHTIRWRTDPQFQSYTDGWAYSASTKTLFLKIKHREELEELIVHFQPE